MNKEIERNEEKANKEIERKEETKRTMIVKLIEAEKSPDTIKKYSQALI